MNDLEKETIGELIGFVQGTYTKQIPDVQKTVYEIMDLLVDNHIQEAYDLVIKSKQCFLPGCMSCLTPCGNSGCYTIDQDTQIKKYKALKQHYHRDMDYIELCQLIVEIGY